MPEMSEYSAVAAVHTLWLAAPAEGIGMRWVPILDPRTIAAVLEVPPDWKLIGYFCLGFPEAEDDVPALLRLRGRSAIRLRRSCFAVDEPGLRPTVSRSGAICPLPGIPTPVDGPLGNLVWRVVDAAGYWLMQERAAGLLAVR
jgi:hypothetical protein